MTPFADEFAELIRRGSFAEALTLAAAETARAQAAGDVLAEAWGLAAEGEALRMLDRNEECLARGQQAAALVADREDETALRVKSEGLRLQSSALRMMGQPDLALTTSQQATAVARQANWPRGEADSLQIQIYMHLNADRNEEALALVWRALELARSCGHRRGEANALDAASDVLHKLGEYERALEMARQAAAICHELGDALREGNAVFSQAEALLELDAHDQALERTQAATALYAAVGDRLGQANTLRSQADVLRKLDRCEEALAQAEQAEALYLAIGSRFGPGSAVRAQAEALQRLGRFAEAMERARRAEELFTALSYRQGQAEALLVQALAAEGLGDKAAAAAAAAQASELFTACGMPGQAEYAAYVARSLAAPPATDPGARAVARLHAEFGAELGDILASADRTEDAWHRELRKPRREPCAPGTGEFRVLKQWPSYATLSLLPYPDEVAGGYLLRWEDRNLVVDPGLGFLAALRQSNFHLADLDGVVITHWHIDHTGDMEELLTCLFEANEEGAIAEVDFFLPPGAFGVYASLLAHNPAARNVTLLRPGEQAIWGPMRLTAIAAGHRDLTGREGDAIGLRVGLCDASGAEVVQVGLTSDTRWDPRLVEPLSHLDLLVLHLGGIYSRDLKADEYAKNHLGVKGTAALLSALSAAGAPKLALLAEIGKELEYERLKLTRILGDVTACRLVPAELGMTVRLPAAEVACDGHGCAAGATHWGMDPRDRRRICARCGECTAPLDATEL